MQTISNFTTYNNWEPDAILNGVMNNHISIVGGYQDGNPSTGHTWIIDGYAMCIKANREILKQYDLYFMLTWDGTVITMVITNSIQIQLWISKQVMEHSTLTF